LTEPRFPFDGHLRPEFATCGFDLLNASAGTEPDEAFFVLEQSGVEIRRQIDYRANLREGIRMEPHDAFFSSYPQSTIAGLQQCFHWRVNRGGGYIVSTRAAHNAGSSSDPNTPIASGTHNTD
jgi:hypothetical protein